MGFYRVKVVKCIDVIIKAETLKHALENVRYLLLSCGDDSRIFVHKISKEGDMPRDEGLMFKGTVKEVLHHMLE